jgi:hypothetical protein
VLALRQIGDSRGLEAVARVAGADGGNIDEDAARALSGEGYQQQLNKAKRITRIIR